MKTNLKVISSFRCLVLCLCCMLTACKVEENPGNDPLIGDVKVTFSVMDRNWKDGMKLRYYIFDEGGEVVPVDATGKVVREMGALSKEGTLSGIEKNLLDMYTIVALAYDKEESTELNNDVKVMTDPLIRAQSGLLKGDYFYASAVKNVGKKEVKLELKRPAGQIAVELLGADEEVKKAVKKVEFVPAKGVFSGNLLCDGTWSASVGTDLSYTFDNDTEGWMHACTTTASSTKNGGQLKITYQLEGQDEASSVLEVTPEHEFYVASGHRTTFKITLHEAELGKLEPSFSLDTDWAEGRNTTDDQTDGTESRFFYNYVTEFSFNPKMSSSAMAVSGNVLFVPTGMSSATGGGNKLSVEYWDIDTRTKLGTLPIPADLNGTFDYRVFSLYCLGNYLFVGHGQYLLMSRVDVYDISDISNPHHVTYIGGGEMGYVPGKEHNLISVPYAMWGKDGKLLLLDYYKLSVYDVNSLTAEDAGNIMPVKYMMVTSDIGDSAEGDAGFACTPDGSLYVTHPVVSDSEGLRKINWDNVVSPTTGEVTDLLDADGLRLPEVSAKRILFFDKDVLVFDKKRSTSVYRIEYYKEVKGDAINALNFFRPTIVQPNNALLLEPKADGANRMIVSSANGKVTVVRIDKIPVIDF